jgi:Ca2+-binding RTX toxin-like protein
MTSPTGGRWIFSVDTVSGFSGVVLGINNGVAPIFPTPQVGMFNIEVFTNPTVAGLTDPPIPPSAGFQSTMTDPNGTIGNDGLLTGTSLQLGSGDFLAVDSVTGSPLQSGSRIELGSGKQTVVGAKGDTLIGGTGFQILSALAGNQTVIGGSNNESIWGGANDSIAAGTGANRRSSSSAPAPPSSPASAAMPWSPCPTRIPSPPLTARKTSSSPPAPTT